MFVLLFFKLIMPCQQVKASKTKSGKLRSYEEWDK